MKKSPQYSFIIELHRTDSKPDEVRTCIIEMYRMRSENLKLLVQLFWGLAAAMAASLTISIGSGNYEAIYTGIVLVVLLFFVFGMLYYIELLESSRQITTSWLLYRLLKETPPDLFL